MRAIVFKIPEAILSIVILIALVWISFGSAKLAGTLAVALAASDP